MVDLWIGSVKVNSAIIRVSINSIDVQPRFTNASHAISGQYRPVNYAVSGDDEGYSLEFTMYAKGGSNFSLLKAKEKEIYDELRTQIGGSPVLIRTGSSDDPIYLSFQSVYCLAVSPIFSTKGTNGKNLMNVNLDFIALGAPVSEGGDVTPSETWTAVSL